MVLSMSVSLELPASGTANFSLCFKDQMKDLRAEIPQTKAPHSGKICCLGQKSNLVRFGE